MSLFVFKDNSCGDGEIGKTIMHNVLKEIVKKATENDVLLFLNEGVNFLCKTEFEEIIASLKNIPHMKVYACEYSLGELGLKEFLKVGKPVNFETIAQLLRAEDAVFI